MQESWVKTAKELRRFPLGELVNFSFGLWLKISFSSIIRGVWNLPPFDTNLLEAGKLNLRLRQSWDWSNLKFFCCNGLFKSRFELFEGDEAIDISNLDLDWFNNSLKILLIFFRSLAELSTYPFSQSKMAVASKLSWGKSGSPVRSDLFATITIGTSGSSYGRGKNTSNQISRYF